VHIDINFRPGVGTDPLVGPSLQEGFDRIPEELKGTSSETVKQNLDAQWFYTYILYSPEFDLYYIGSRYSLLGLRPGDPNVVDQDYEGSHEDKEKYMPYDKVILTYHDSSEAPLEVEEFLHELWDVRCNPNFINKVNAPKKFFNIGPLSPETRQKLSLAMKKVMSDPKHREKISAATKKGMNDPNVRKKLSNSKKGNKYALGHKHSDETKKVMSEKQKGNKHALGHKHSDETKKLMSDKKKGREISAETRRKISIALKGNKNRMEKGNINADV
jgi:hypothetical protein